MRWSRKSEVTSQAESSGRLRHKCLSNKGWQRYSFLVVSTFALIAGIKSAAAEDRSDLVAQRIGTGNPSIGKLKSVDGRCLECHGEEGISNDVKVPNHAGQYAGYLIKQLSNFQTGERRHPIMNIMAEDISANDKADISAYFASQKTMQGEAGNDNPQARNLFINGNQGRDIPACVSCHGDSGKGRVADNIFYPVIGGQRSIYLRIQLINWKLEDRSNSPGGVMNKIAKALSEDEINALADYISGL
jgi:cytochrome c553